MRVTSAEDGTALHTCQRGSSWLQLCNLACQMLDPYTLWEGTLPTGQIARLLICPLRREVLAVLHMDDRMRRLEPCRTREEAEQHAWAIRDELFEQFAS